MVMSFPDLHTGLRRYEIFNKIKITKITLLYLEKYSYQILVIVRKIVLCVQRCTQDSVIHFKNIYLNHLINLRILEHVESIWKKYLLVNVSRSVGES